LSKQIRGCNRTKFKPLIAFPLAGVSGLRGTGKKFIYRAGSDLQPDSTSKNPLEVEVALKPRLGQQDPQDAIPEFLLVNGRV
jgi:hypothetical protein